MIRKSQLVLIAALCLLVCTGCMSAWAVWSHGMPQALSLFIFGVLCITASSLYREWFPEASDGNAEGGKLATSGSSISHLPVATVNAVNHFQGVSRELTGRAIAPRPSGASRSATAANSKAITNAFSIDLEDYFHTEVASKAVHASEWSSMPSRVEASTMRLLEILDRTDTRATVFVLGWVARKHPALVRHIAQQGHEIACHSDRHRAVFTLSPQEFFEDTRKAKDSIEQVSGAAIKGYRAPSFSITPGTEWAFDVLAHLGFRYDSSVNPVRHSFYGNPLASRFPYYVANCALLEIPIATWRLFGNNFPVGGGAYLRLLPEGYIRAGIRSINKKDREPATMYVHPWEIDSCHPHLDLDWKSRTRQTAGVSAMEGKLERLLGGTSFAPIADVYSHVIPHWDYPVSEGYLAAKKMEILN